MIQHHVSDELLLDHATGSLSEGWRIAVATHLALCPHCRSRLRTMEMAGGALMAEADPVEAEDDSWERLRATLLDAEARRRPDTSAEPAVPGDRDIVLPEPLRSYLGGDVDSLKWKPLGLGAYHIPIATDDKTTTARLLRIPAGKPVPEHGHGGRELTLVLAGSFHDGEMLFARGDLEEADQDLQHQPVATPDQDCICLAVTDAPLRFRSRLLRLVQPLLGI